MCIGAKAFPGSRISFPCLTRMDFGKLLSNRLIYASVASASQNSGGVLLTYLDVALDGRSAHSSRSEIVLAGNTLPHVQQSTETGPRVTHGSIHSIAMREGGLRDDHLYSGA